MKKLLPIIFMAILVVWPVSAQDRSNSRLYVSLSPQLTIVRSDDNQTLLVKDYLNSTREEIDRSGKSLGEHQYLPFGDSITGHPREDEDPGIVIDKLFTNHRKLENLSVYHAGARFYSPTAGQFIQPDRVEGVNRYAYVRNSPVLFTDPTGNEAKGIYAQIPDADFIKNDFPQALSLVDGTYSANRQRPLRSVFFEDDELDDIVMDYSARLDADYRLLYHRESFLRDFSETFSSENPYNQRMNSMQVKKKKLEKLNLRIPFTNLVINPAFKEQIINRSEIDAEFRTGVQLTLAQKIQQEKLICVDYANFTTYFLAQHGIRSGILQITNTDKRMYHNLNVIEIDHVQYALDVTNNFFERYDEPAVVALYGSGKYMKLIEPYGEAIYNDAWHEFFNQNR